MNGKTLSANDIDRIRVSRSEQDSRALVQAVREGNARSSVVAFIPLEWQAAHLAEDVTDDFILGPPGYERVHGSVGARSVVARATSRKVFVVHGHDEAARESVARFLEGLDFDAIILHEQASRGRTVIEKVEAHSDVGFAVVLLTPDDVGCVKGGTPAPRARQNVVLELGYFVGSLGRNHVCALKRGEVEIPSDFEGVVYVDFDSSGAWKQALGKELAAEFEIDWNKVMRP